MEVIQHHYQCPPFCTFSTADGRCACMHPMIWHWIHRWYAAENVQNGGLKSLTRNHGQGCRDRTSEPISPLLFSWFADRWQPSKIINNGEILAGCPKVLSQPVHEQLKRYLDTEQQSCCLSTGLPVLFPINLCKHRETTRQSSGETTTFLFCV